MLKILALVSGILLTSTRALGAQTYSCPEPENHDGENSPSEDTTRECLSTTNSKLCTTSQPTTAVNSGCQNTENGRSGFDCSTQIPSIGGSCDSCAHPSICANPQINTDGPADSDSPYYQHIRSKVDYVPDLDNACLTLFPLTTSTFLAVRSEVFKNGTFVIHKYLYAFTGSTGIYRGEGLTNSSGYTTNYVFNDYVYGGLDGYCKGIYVVYRCYVYGDCVRTLEGTDMRTGYSIYTMPKIPELCYSQLASLMNSQNFKTPDLVRLPNCMPRKCVTHMAGLKCINAEYVEPGNGISLP